MTERDINPGDIVKHFKREILIEEENLSLMPRKWWDSTRYFSEELYRVCDHA